MTRTGSQKLKGIKKLFLCSGIIMLLFSILLFSIPLLAKANELTAIGKKTANELEAFALSLSHLKGQSIQLLSTENAKTKAVGEIEELLTMVCSLKGYDGITLIGPDTKDKTSYRVLADSQFSYGSVGQIAGLAAGSTYPLTVYTAAKKPLQEIFSEQGTYTYTDRLIKAQSGAMVSNVFMPISYKGEVIAVLAIDCLPRNPNYHMAGPVNLEIMAWVLFAIAACSFFGLFLAIKYGHSQDIQGEIPEQLIAQEEEESSQPTDCKEEQ